MKAFFSVVIVMTLLWSCDNEVLKHPPNERSSAQLSVEIVSDYYSVSKTDLIK